MYAAKNSCKGKPPSLLKLRVSSSLWNLEWYLLHSPKAAGRPEILTQACQPVHAGQDFRLLYAEIRRILHAFRVCRITELNKRSNNFKYLPRVYWAAHRWRVCDLVSFFGVDALWPLSSFDAYFFDVDLLAGVIKCYWGTSYVSKLIRKMYVFIRQVLCVSRQGKEFYFFQGLQTVSGALPASCSVRAGVKQTDHPRLCNAKAEKCQELYLQCHIHTRRAQMQLGCLVAIIDESTEFIHVQFSTEGDHTPTDFARDKTLLEFYRMTTRTWMRLANPGQYFVLLFDHKCTLPKCDTNDSDFYRASFFVVCTAALSHLPGHPLTVSCKTLPKVKSPRLYVCQASRHN